MFEILIKLASKKISQLSSIKLILIGIILTLSLITISVLFFKTSDEDNWVKSGKYFTDAIATFNPEGTYVTQVSHRLGVSVLWISAGIYSIFGSLTFNNLLKIHRLVFLLINLGLFFSAINILRKYIHTRVLILAILYLLLNRFFPIIGRSTWLDQFLTFFGLLTVIFWTKYLFERKHSQLITASIFNGLLLLTKYAGWYFTPIIIALSWLYCYRHQMPFTKVFKPLILLVFSSLFIFILFYPAVWIDPYKTLFLRLEDTTTVVKKTQDIWDYLLEIRLISPILIIGAIFTFLDWKRKKLDFLFFFSLAGIFYLSIYVLTFLGLIVTSRLDYPFLEGVYRYTFPAIPILTLYTFSRYKIYIKTRDLQIALILFLFVWEIIFSPFLIFGRF